MKCIRNILLISFLFILFSIDSLIICSWASLNRGEEHLQDGRAYRKHFRAPDTWRDIAEKYENRARDEKGNSACRGKKGNEGNDGNEGNGRGRLRTADQEAQNVTCRKRDCDSVKPYCHALRSVNNAHHPPLPRLIPGVEAIYAQLDVHLPCTVFVTHVDAASTTPFPSFPLFPSFL